MALPWIRPWADLWLLLYIRFVALAFQLCRRSSLEKGPSLTYYGPALDPPLGGFVIIAIHSVSCSSLPTLQKKSFGEGPLIDQYWLCPGSLAFQLWRRSPLEKGTSLIYYGPALDPPLGGFVIIAIHSICCSSLPTLKKSFREGPLIDLLWPCPWSAPGWIWPKSQYKCAGSWVLYPTKFGKYPSSDSVVKADSDCIPIHIHALVHPRPFSPL